MIGIVIEEGGMIRSRECFLVSLNCESPSTLDLDSRRTTSIVAMCQLLESTQGILMQYAMSADHENLGAQEHPPSDRGKKDQTHRRGVTGFYSCILAKKLWLEK